MPGKDGIWTLQEAMAQYARFGYNVSETAPTHEVADLDTEVCFCWEGNVLDDHMFYAWPK